jgi:hypothetical protein
MRILRWIWWAGGLFFGLLCFGYAVAFAGYGLSLWVTKPEPDALLLTLAFLGAGVGAIEYSIKEAETLVSRPHRGDGT